MEEDNSIDNLFRSAIEPFEVEPPEKVWSSLDAELAKGPANDQNRKRRGLWFLLALTFLAASVEMYVVFGPSRSTVAVNSNPVVSSAKNTEASGSVPDADKNKPASQISQSQNSVPAGQTINGGGVPATESKSAVNEGVDKMVGERADKQTSGGNINSSNGNAGQDDVKSAATERTGGASDKGTASRAVQHGSDVASNAGTDKNLSSTASTKPGKAPASNRKNADPMADNVATASIAPNKKQKTKNTGLQASNVSLNKKNAASPVTTIQENTVSAENSTNTPTVSEQPAKPLDVNDHKAGADNKEAGVPAVEANVIAPDIKDNSPAANDNTARTSNLTTETNTSATVNNTTSSGQDNNTANQNHADVTTTDKPASAPEEKNAAPAPAAITQAPKEDASGLPKMGTFITRTSASVYYGPERANRYFKDGSSTASTSTTSTTEKFNSSYNAGARFLYDLGSKWGLGLGISYSTLEQLTSVTTSYIVPPDTGGSQQHPHHDGWHDDGHDGFPDHGFDSSFTHHFTDTSFCNHYFNYSNTNHNYSFNTSCGSVHLDNPPVFPVSQNAGHTADTVRFTTNTTLTLQYLNVPVFIKYQFTTKRLSFYANAGVTINFLLNKQARVVIGDAYNVTSTDIAGLRSKYYGWMFGMGAQYQLYRRFSVFLEPAARGSLTSITDDTQPSTFYPYSFGANIGLTYHF